MHDRIPARLRNRITVNPITDCWIYKGSTPSSNGYERCWLYGSRWQTHRLIFELVTGKDIRTKQLDHLCEVKQCCNPAHLDPVTPSRNCKRKFNRRKFPSEFKYIGRTNEI